MLFDNSPRYWLGQLKPGCCSEYLVKSRTSSSWAGLKQKRVKRVLFPWIFLSISLNTQFCGHIWSLSGFPASSVMTCGVQEIKSKVFVSCCVSVLGVSCLFQGPCGISVPKTAYTFTPGLCVCVFWDATLAFKGMYKPHPVWCIPSYKSTWTGSALPQFLLFITLDAGVCWPCLCSFLLHGLNAEFFSLVAEVFLSLPLTAPLALPHQWEKKTLLCAMKHSPGLQQPHQLQGLFYQLFRTRLPRST